MVDATRHPSAVLAVRTFSVRLPQTLYLTVRHEVPNIQSLTWDRKEDLTAPLRINSP
jgi:hypothetical protein